jgi:hypothetical protein
MFPAAMMPDGGTFLSSAAMTKRPKCPVAPVTTIIKTPFDGDARNYPSDSRRHCAKYTIFNM